MAGMRRPSHLVRRTSLWSSRTAQIVEISLGLAATNRGTSRWRERWPGPRSPSWRITRTGATPIFSTRERLTMIPLREGLTRLTFKCYKNLLRLNGRFLYLLPNSDPWVRVSTSFTTRLFCWIWKYRRNFTWRFLCSGDKKCLFRNYNSRKLEITYSPFSSSLPYNHNITLFTPNLARFDYHHLVSVLMGI